MKSKILVVGQLPPPHHGSNVMAETFYQTLKQLGFTVYISEKKFSKKMEEVGKSSILKLLKLPIVICSNILIVISKKRPDICFYFASVKPPSLYFDLLMIFIINFFGCDIVLYLHGKGYEKIWHKNGFILRFFLHRIFSSCLGAIVLGQTLKNDIDRHISNERIFVLPNCISEGYFSEKASMKKIYKNKVIQVLYLSNLVPSKGPIEFIKLAKKVAHCRGNVRFIVAGAASPDHEILSEIRRFIQKHELEKVVYQIGEIYGKEKELLFLKSDIFVFPTYFELETFGLVNLEAMRAGLPVISTNEGCIPEIIIDGLNGYIVDPKNIDQLSQQVIKLIDNDEQRVQMGAASRKIFETKYTPKIYRKELNRAVKFFIKLKD